MNDTQLPPQNHPEQRKDETFLQNCYSGEPDQFADIEFQTKRAGKLAYDIFGVVQLHFFPVFVLTTEYDRLKREVQVGQ